MYCFFGKTSGNSQSNSIREIGAKRGSFLYLIVPVPGIATFVPAWLTSAGIKVFSFVVPLTPPSSYMGPGVGGFMLVGVVYLGYLYARHPRRVTEVGLVHLDEPAADPAGADPAGEEGTA